MLDGSKYAFDGLVCAIGFHASFRPAFPFIGRKDTNLAEVRKKDREVTRESRLTVFRTTSCYLDLTVPLPTHPSLFALRHRTLHCQVSQPVAERRRSHVRAQVGSGR